MPRDQAYVETDGRSLTADDIIIATGSDAAIPPVDGLDTVPVWTNREATSLRDIPSRMVMLGGSAVGSELGQFLHRFGAQVTIVERRPPCCLVRSRGLGNYLPTGCASTGLTG